VQTAAGEFPEQARPAVAREQPVTVAPDGLMAVRVRSWFCSSSELRVMVQVVLLEPGPG
jgi:hypothetical protein